MEYRTGRIIFIPPPKKLTETASVEVVRVSGDVLSLGSHSSLMPLIILNAVGSIQNPFLKFRGFSDQYIFSFAMPIL